MGVRLPEREAGQVFEARPVGPPAASVFAFGIVVFLLLVSNGRPIGGGEDLAAALAGKAAASALSAAAATLLFKAMGRANGESEARGAAALVALGTGLWAASQALGPQPIAALAIAAAVLLLLKGGDEPAWAGRAGLPLGLAVAAWPASAGLVAALGLGVAVRWPRRIPWLVSWGLPGIAARFAAQPFLPATFATGLEGLGEGLGQGHLGLLVSPAKGLLVFTPLAIVAVVGWVRAWRWGERWLVATLAGAVLAHLALVGASSEWHGGSGWGPTALTAAVPPLFLLLPEGLAALPRVGAFLATISVAVQLLGAFAYDQRWERLYQHPAKPGHPELWDVAHSPIPFYARRRVVILAVPALRHGKVFIREHRLVVGGAKGSRITFAGGDLVVRGADATASDIHLQGGARVVGEKLRLSSPGDGLFLRVRPVARLRQLELRIAGRGSGAIAVGERTFWSDEPRSREYAVAGDFRIRHPYRYADSGGADVLVALGRGEASLAAVSLVAPGDPENPFQLP
jgi:hypothetical protein